MLNSLPLETKQTRKTVTVLWTIHSHMIWLTSSNKTTGGLHCRHVLNKKEICWHSLHKNRSLLPERKILLFLYTNMAAMTSHANHRSNFLLIVCFAHAFHCRSKTIETLTNLSLNNLLVMKLRRSYRTIQPTCISLSFSLFLIQAFPWPCGSIKRGYRVALVTMMPFCTDNSSFGKPWRFHSPTWNKKTHKSLTYTRSFKIHWNKKIVCQ